MCALTNLHCHYVLVRSMIESSGWVEHTVSSMLWSVPTPVVSFLRLPFEQVSFFWNGVLIWSRWWQQAKFALWVYHMCYNGFNLLFELPAALHVFAWSRPETLQCSSVTLQHTSMCTNSHELNIAHFVRLVRDNFILFLIVWFGHSYWFSNYLKRDKCDIPHIL